MKLGLHLASPNMVQGAQLQASVPGVAHFAGTSPAAPPVRAGPIVVSY
jgi:hypothetical protein